MKFSHSIKRFWYFLNKDTWQSWLVSLVLIVALIKLVFFPLLSLITGSSLPLVVVDSCSMYHESIFEEWWSKNAEWYEAKDIEKKDFSSFPLKNGFNKGDIIFVWKETEPKIGDIIIFKANPEADAKLPIIHRVVSTNPTATKGDHNTRQLTITNNEQGIDETSIKKEDIVGKAVFKIPMIGWVKLIFFEPFKPQQQRGFCI
ncbi:MAG: S26 family signal peptidase [Nanoarchaeota archaeon]